jgi:phospholipid/cholesterol/gamma-HCH transport system substrate-binding protein
MTKEFTRNIRLGIFVLAGTAFLIMMLYFIGSKQNLFGSTFKISARFYTVNGLMAGNNVRFSGIDVGTVESVEIISDSTVNVVMVIEEKVRPYIKKNAMASIGTDGLMGNKLVNINSTADNSAPVEEGDIIETVRPLEMDDMTRTLNITNENLAQITSDVKIITHKINNTHGTLWMLLNDTSLSHELKQTVENIQAVSAETRNMSKEISDMIAGINRGEGLAGTLLTDTAASRNLKQTLESIKAIGEKTDSMSSGLNSIIGKINRGDGAASALVNDTALAADLRRTMKSIQKGTDAFSEDMEALKHSWPFRKYFRKKEKGKIK